MASRAYRGTRNLRAVQTLLGHESIATTERYTQVAAFLAIQELEAQWWRDASIAYFQSVSQRPLPAGFAPPPQSLQYYESLCFPYAPGNRSPKASTCRE